MATKLLEEKSKIISVASRINELRKEKNIAKKIFYSENNDKNNITRWCNEKNPVNPDRITNKIGFKEIADILDVDVDYLLCRQVERRRKKNSSGWEKFNELINTELLTKEVKLLKVADNLKSLFHDFGYEFVPIPADGEEYEFEFQTIERIDETHFALLTFAETNKTVTSYCYEVRSNGAVIKEISEKTFFKFMESITAHMKLEIELLLESDKQL